MKTFLIYSKIENNYSFCCTLEKGLLFIQIVWLAYLYTCKTIMTQKQPKCYKKSYFEMKIKLIYIVTNLPRGPWATSLTWKTLPSKKKLEQSYYTSRLVKSHYNLPLKRSLAFHFNKIESPLLKDALSQVWFKLAWWIWKRFLNVLKYFAIISPEKKSKLESPLCAKFLLNWSSGSREEDKNMKDFQWWQQTNFDQKCSL